MKLNLFKKVCLTVMGVGVVSSLVSVGTFATFTATTTNPGNSVASGTLTMKNLIGGGLGNVGGAANVTSGGATSFNSGATDCQTNGKIATTCNTPILTTQVTSEGLEPGQYVQGTVQLTNSGNLPATVTVNAQNLTSTNTTCPSDIAGASVTGGPAAPDALGACQTLGAALNITLQDSCPACATTTHCIYGTGSATQVTAAGTAVTGSCDTISVSTGAAGTKLVTSNTAVAPADPFGTSAASAGSFWKLVGPSATSYITLPGGAAGNRWAPGEIHTVTITIAFPDQGLDTTATLGTDTVTIGNDTVFQGGGIAFDLIWLAQQ